MNTSGSTLGKSAILNVGEQVFFEDSKSEFSKDSLEAKWKLFGRNNGAPIAEKIGITLYAKPCLIRRTVNGQGVAKEGVEYWYENQRGNRVLDFDGGFAEVGHYQTASYEDFESKIAGQSLKNFKAKPVIMDYKLK